MFELEPVRAEVSRTAPDELNRTIKAVVLVADSSHRLLHRPGTTRRVAYTGYLNDEESVAYVADYFGQDGFKDYTINRTTGPLGVPVTASFHNGICTVTLGIKPFDADASDFGINEYGLPYASAVLSDETARALELPVES